MRLCNGKMLCRLRCGGGLGLISYIWMFVFRDFMPISTKQRFFPLNGIWKKIIYLEWNWFLLSIAGGFSFQPECLICFMRLPKKIPKYWPPEFWLMFPGTLFWKHSVSTLCYRCSCIQWNPVINIFQWT